MTQVQTMSKATLNQELAVLMGWTEIRVLVPSERLMGRDPVDKWATYIPDYCTDPAASLEVQTAACELNGELYIWNLAIIQGWVGGTIISRKEGVRIATATLRERAEAAYITLSSKQ